MKYNHHFKLQKPTGGKAAFPEWGKPQELIGAFSLSRWLLRDKSVGMEYSRCVEIR